MSKGAVAIGAVAVLAVVGVVAVLEERPPRVDHALAQQVLPVIDEALQREGPWPTAEGRWFCAEDVIEIRETKVGVHALCDAYRKDGTGLRAVGGESAAKLVTLTEAPHRVLKVEMPPDGAGNAEWIDKNFSKAGAAEVHRRIGNAGDLGTRAAAEARLAFGLPPDAPIHR